MDDGDEHLAQHRDLALLLADNDPGWVAAVSGHLRDMHGIEGAEDPVFLHRQLHPPGP